MKKILIIVAMAILLGVAWYGLSPLFRAKKVDEALPMAGGSKQEASSPMENRTLPEAETSEAFPVIGTKGHPALGQVRIVRTGDETVIRYENYKTINGPDLLVYLSKDLDVKEYVNLGPIKGTEGNINYPVPAGIDVSEYRYALTWCEDFSVLFNSADLSSRK